MSLKAKSTLYTGRDYMDHLEAIQLSAVEKYLLDELPPETRDAFEEHYFDCSECMTDLQATSAFMEAAREELRSNPLQRPSPSIVAEAPADMKRAISQQALKKPKLMASLFQRPIFIISALAASLLVIVYQNTILYPHLESEVAELHGPAILPTLSLAGSNSRGGAVPSLVVKAAHPYLISVDIPTDERFTSYACELHSPSGKVLWRVPVTAEAAKDTVTIHAPSMSGSSGHYTVVIQGNTGAISSGISGAGSIELARDSFELLIQ